uniref:Non-structural protein NS2 n=1 Tax=Epizootic hemorrhagic disease virus TaxID=40054 RepID=A0A1B0UG49_9REOV|nr:NS2 protein [Epizootic hemorrhagic disease virus]ALX38603.1 NS2 protein [Epizootic hemorrhagic disease virus]ALX38604.1 NS2 protein [Epizootic hemorrhagic disease virus]ALX38607.1 NS2 protein [Epizootic hemorrhagic disease virus]
MEQKQRRFTKNVFVLDQKRKTLCGQIAARQSLPYCQIKIGRNFALKAVATPEPKGYVLEICDVGAYRIQDGNDVISLMISADGVEGTQERWEEWKFETISCVPMATVLNINGALVDAEIKVSKGMGMVPPYTRNDFDRRELPELPGVQRSKYDIRELRQKIREEREKGAVEQPHKPAFKTERWHEQPDSDEDQNLTGGVVSDWTCETQERDQEAERREALEIRLAEQRQRIEAFKLDSERKREDLKRSQERNRTQEVERKKPDMGEIIIEEDDEDSEEEEGARASYITSAYIERISRIRKTKDERLSMLASMMPQQSGEYTTTLFIKKQKWDNVPLYLIDEMQKKYELQSVGSCERVAFVSKGTNLIILPVGV